MRINLTPIIIITIFFILSGGREPAGGKGARKSGIRIPPGYTVSEPKTIIWKEDGYELRLYSRNFSQGDAVYFEFVPEKGGGKHAEIKKLLLQGKELLYSRKSWGIIGFFSLDPNEKAGTRVLTLDILIHGRGYSGLFAFDVDDARFPVSRHELDLGKYSNMSYIMRDDIQQRIKYFSRLKKAAFSVLSGNSLTSRMSHPRDMHEVSSAFWAKRYYYTYRIEKGKREKTAARVRIHRGIDLKGEKGDPVYAIADGTVVLAVEMFYEGNFIVIDHGNRIFSYYMHQDELKVKEGRRVKGGEIIGRVGSTGVSTGPHLHVSLIINGVHADPLSLMWLPVR